MSTRSRLVSAVAAFALIQAATAFSVSGSVSEAAVRQRLAHHAASLDVLHGTETSTNWSGYAVQTKPGRKFTAAAGRWVQPRVVNCSLPGARYASFWLGIDGYSSNSVEQVGTDSDCLNGTAVYYAWWEMYPAGTMQLSSKRYPVKPGDTLSARVAAANDKFVLTLRSSEGWTFTTEQTGSGFRQSSAEWLAEAPQIGGTTAGLAQFSGFGFSKCSASTNSGAPSPISSFAVQRRHRMNMVTAGGATKATTSPLSRNGHAFIVNWNRA